MLPPRPSWPADEITTAVRLGRIEVRGGRVAGHEQRQLEEVAAVERQHVDEGRRYDRVDDRTTGVDRDQTDAALDVHVFADAFERQFDDHRCGLADFERDTLSFGVTEPRRRNLDVHRPGCQVGGNERAVRAGHDSPARASIAAVIVTTAADTGAPCGS